MVCDVSGTAAVIVANRVALVTIADRPIAVIRGALNMKARAHGHFVCRSTILLKTRTNENISIKLFY